MFCNTDSRCIEKGISFHKFPRDPKLRKLWSKFVNRTRNWPGPTSASVLCSKHFAQNCYHNYNQFQLGLFDRLMLTADAIPTIHPEQPCPTAGSTKKRSSFHGETELQRPAYKKREIQRVSNIFMGNNYVRVT